MNMMEADDGTMVVSVGMDGSEMNLVRKYPNFIKNLADDIGIVQYSVLIARIEFKFNGIHRQSMKNILDRLEEVGYSQTLNYYY